MGTYNLSVRQQEVVNNSGVLLYYSTLDGSTFKGGQIKSGNSFVVTNRSASYMICLDSALTKPILICTPVKQVSAGSSQTIVGVGMYVFTYMDSNGRYTMYKYTDISKYSSPTGDFINLVVSDNYGGGGAVTISNLGNLVRAEMDGVSKTSFPVTFKVNEDKTIYVEGKADPVITFDGQTNVSNIVVDGVGHTQFPFASTITKDMSVTATGEADKEITINYTNTDDPVITNT